jgi:hypothetical protein
VFLTGPSGVGKGWLAHLLKGIYSSDNCTGITLSEFESQFTAHWAARQMVIIEECERVKGKGSRMYTRLKDVITNSEVQYHAKGVTPVFINNHVNLLLEGNDLGALGKVDEFDRRIAAIEIARGVAMANDPEYWRPRFDWIEQGEGVGAVYHHLLGLDMTGFDPKGVPPMTQAKRDMIDLGLNDQEQFITELMGNAEEVLGDYDGELFTSRELYWIMLDGSVAFHELGLPEHASDVMSFSKALRSARVPQYPKRVKNPYDKKPTSFWQIPRKKVALATGSATTQIRTKWRDALYQGVMSKM